MLGIVFGLLLICGAVLRAGIRGGPSRFGSGSGDGHAARRADSRSRPGAVAGERNDSQAFGGRASSAAAGSRQRSDGRHRPRRCEVRTQRQIQQSPAPERPSAPASSPSAAPALRTSSVANAGAAGISCRWQRIAERTTGRSACGSRFAGPFTAVRPALPASRGSIHGADCRGFAREMTRRAGERAAQARLRCERSTRTCRWADPCAHRAVRHPRRSQPRGATAAGRRL